MYRYRFKTEKKKEFLKGKTITELSEKVGIDRSYLSRLLNAKKATKLYTVLGLLKASNVNGFIEDYFDKVD